MNYKIIYKNNWINYSIVTGIPVYHKGKPYGWCATKNNNSMLKFSLSMARNYIIMFLPDIKNYYTNSKFEIVPII